MQCIKTSCAFGFNVKALLLLLPFLLLFSCSEYENPFLRKCSYTTTEGDMWWVSGFIHFHATIASWSFRWFVWDSSFYRSNCGLGLMMPLFGWMCTFFPHNGALVFVLFCLWAGLWFIRRLGFVCQLIQSILKPGQNTNHTCWKF